MVERIVGYDKNNKKIFERDAREYDQKSAVVAFGITVSDIIRIVPIIFLCGIVWANQQSTNQNLARGLTENSLAIKEMASSNYKTLGLLNDYISKMDSYLSASTGKRFRNGDPL